MIISIIGILIGALVLGAGIYYLIKEKMIKSPVRFMVLSAVSAEIKKFSLFQHIFSKNCILQNLLTSSANTI